MIFRSVSVFFTEKRLRRSKLKARETGRKGEGKKGEGGGGGESKSSFVHAPFRCCFRPHNLNASLEEAMLCMVITNLILYHFENERGHM